MTDFSELKAKAGELPSKPGIYFFKNAKGDVVYIGKARSLRDRVRTYFLANPDDKVRNILRETSDIDYILTGSDKEAFFLENNYIQQHQPRFNLRLKDDKSYPYLRVSTCERYPRISFSRSVAEDKARYFGPFNPADNARKSIRLINKYFRIRGCEDAVFRGRRRPCLDFDLGLCSGPCVGLIKEEEYRDNVESACLFLEGRTRELAKVLGGRMKRAAVERRFEEAAKWRDLLRTIEDIEERPQTISVALENQDVVGYARDGDEIAIYVFIMRKGRIRESTEIILSERQGRPDFEILGEFLRDYYREHLPPSRLLVPFAPSGPGRASPVLLPQNARTRILVPRGGPGRKLLDLADKNALALLEKKGRELAPLDDLKHALGLESLPRTIEGFDISNTGGRDSVGSLVVFRDGRPDKGEYRKFKIRTVTGPNDTASLEEVIRRRYARLREEGRRMPDLVMVDGGKGQLTAARKALSEAGIESPPVVSIAKREDILFTADRKSGIRLDQKSQALRLIQRIRDEAHRFAVTHHRSRRTKTSFESSLDGIPGLGPKRKTALLLRYRNLETIQGAPWDEIVGLLGRQAAENLKKRLSQGRKA